MKDELADELRVFEMLRRMRLLSSPGGELLGPGGRMFECPRTGQQS